jgi:hypothetical protein
MVRSKLSIKQAFLGLGLLAAAGLFAFSFHAVGGEYLSDWALDIGRITIPNSRMLYFYGFWTVLGGLACWALASGASTLLDISTSHDQPPIWHHDTVWMAGCVVAACTLPLVVRVAVLHGAPLTDDEYSYRFMARLLADGRLYAESLPQTVKLFFDRGHMINGGRWYAQYFIGWPALMLPATFVGMPGLANPMYAAITVVPMFLMLRRLGGSRVARYGTLLFAVSPFCVIAAATLTSHVTALLFIICTWWAVIESRHQPEQRRWHLLTALFFSIAFFIRPLAALGMAGPALIYWSINRLRFDATWRATFERAALFAIPALVLAALFLTVNATQTGDPLTPAYQAFHDYATQNGYRFSGTKPDPNRDVANLQFTQTNRQAAVFGTGLFRFNIAALGWPVSLVFVLVAGWRKNWPIWTAAIGYLATRILLHDAGVDTYGPVHFYELMWPLLGLSAFGIDRLTRWGELLDDNRQAEPSTPSSPPLDNYFGQWPLFAVGACIFLMTTCYLPYRLSAVQSVANAARLPVRAAETQTEGRAVIFSPRPFAHPCTSKPARSFVLWRPPNRPTFDDRVVWANHVTVEDDRRLMSYFPERQGWIMFWTDECKLTVIPLSDANPERVPDGLIGGSGEPPDWSKAPEPFDIEQRRQAPPR